MKKAIAMAMILALMGCRTSKEVESSTSTDLSTTHIIREEGGVAPGFNLEMEVTWPELQELQPGRKLEVQGKTGTLTIWKTDSGLIAECEAKDQYIKTLQEEILKRKKVAMSKTSSKEKQWNPFVFGLVFVGIIVFLTNLVIWLARKFLKP